jgi:hypothetical protein
MPGAIAARPTGTAECDRIRHHEGFDMPAPQKPVLLTGASGNLGRVLAPALAAQG